MCMGLSAVMNDGRLWVRFPAGGQSTLKIVAQSNVLFGRACYNAFIDEETLKVLV
jgi:hypothetical protein